MEALQAIDWSRWGLFGMGALMVLVGCGPATAEATAPLIAAGAALAAAALVFPRLRSIDFGGIVKAEIDSDESAHSSLRIDVWRLQRFAWLVCGNAAEARELVEEALAETKIARRHGSDRGVYALRTLVALLENAREHALLRAPAPRSGRARRGEPSDASEDFATLDCRPTVEALAALPVRVRLVYLLRCSWQLPVEEVVKIFSSSPDDVLAAVAQGRRALEAAAP